MKKSLFNKISLKKNKFFPKIRSKKDFVIFNYLVLKKYFFNGLKFFMSKLIIYHDLLLIICYFVLLFIFSFMVRIIFFSGIYLKKLGKIKLEIIWTIIPSIILLILIEPSLELLYLSESFSFKKGQILKIVGHQWYWRYKRDYLNKILKESKDYDSYLEKNKLQNGDFRLLEIDLPLVVLQIFLFFFLLVLEMWFIVLLFLD